MAFLSRLRNLKRPIICAEGYLFEMERRGWVQIGPFVPEVVINDPTAVKQLHREFVRCGSDVIQAFTYYAHRAKMELVDKGDSVTDINKKACDIAFEVQQEFVGVMDPEDLPLVAGGVCNSTIYKENNPENDENIKEQYREQIRLFKEYNCDYVIAETFEYLAEAQLALQVIQEFEMPSAVMMSTIFSDGVSKDGFTVSESCKILKAMGADVVGLNCSRGPETMLPLLKDIKQGFDDDGITDVNIAALPVCYQTNKEYPTMQAFGEIDEKYLILDCHTCTRMDLGKFALDCMDLGVNYIGTCCGGAPHHVRAMAEAVGKKAIASEFSPNLDLHFAFSQQNKSGKLLQSHMDSKYEWGKKDVKYT